MKFYNKLGVRGLEEHTSSSPLDRIMSFLHSFLKKEDEVLDLACGYGRVTIPLAVEGYNIEGLDISPLFLQEAERRALLSGVAIPFTKGDMASLPYEDDTFDKVVCIWSSFNHLLRREEQLRCLDEIYRVLKEGGIAFLDLVNGEDAAFNILKKIGKGEDRKILESSFSGIKGLNYVHDLKSLKKLCSQSKFTECKMEFMEMGDLKRIALFLYK